MREQMTRVADAHALRPAGFKPLLIGIHWPSMDFDRQFQDFDRTVTARLQQPEPAPLDDPATNRALAGALTGITPGRPGRHFDRVHHRRKRGR